MAKAKAVVRAMQEEKVVAVVELDFVVQVMVGVQVVQVEMVVVVEEV